MYKSQNFKQIDNETLSFKISEDKDFKILQLTDMHLGFGMFSRKKDKLALNAVKAIIKMAAPDMIVVTGDSIFPFLPKAGTMNNGKQAKLFIRFMDHFQIPYAVVMGNHDAEMGACCDKTELMDIFSKGRYSMCLRGDEKLTGVGNYFICLTDSDDEVKTVLVMLDSNMYGNGWFFSGFDRIHSDQTKWCMGKLDKIKETNPQAEALAFFHMPPMEIKEAYEKMKLGDRSIVYNFGSIAESGEYFGVSNKSGDFFNEAVKNGCIKGMFFGHDHLNTLSLTYKGIQLTYGMSIDYLGYKGIEKRYTQRGGTLISLGKDGMMDVKMVPLSRVVSTKVKGKSK